MNKFDVLFDMLVEHERDLCEIDKAMINALFYERIYCHVTQIVGDNLDRLLYINKWLLERGRNLKLINKGRLDSSYYTINGGQHILAKSVPLIYISGRVIRDRVSYRKLSFTDRIDIIPKFMRENNLTKKQQKDFLMYIDEKLNVKAELAKIFSENNKSFVREMVTRNSIAFQAINNSIENVERELRSYKEAV